MSLVNASAARVSGHIRLVQRQRGAVWYVKFRRADGRQVQKKLGPAWTERGRPPAGYFTRRTAEEALQAILTDARRGLLDGEERSGVTFGEAVEEWLRYVEFDRKRKPSTVADYRNVANGALLKEFGRDTPLESIDAARVERYRARLLAERRLSDRSINKLLVALHGVFRRAQRAFGSASNPVASVDRQPVRRSGDFAVLEPAEVMALARAAASEQDAAIYIVAAFTGLRMGELRALRWRDVDFARHLVHVRRSIARDEEAEPKSGKVRSVPLIEAAARELDKLSRREHFTDPDDRVFPDEVGGPFNDDALRRRFYTALTAAGIDRNRGTGSLLRFHDLRHSFGTLAVQAFPLSDVRAYMGHADIQTTMLYVHHVPQQDAAQRLSSLVSANVGGANGGRSTLAAIGLGDPLTPGG